MRSHKGTGLLPIRILVELGDTLWPLCGVVCGVASVWCGLWCGVCGVEAVVWSVVWKLTDLSMA